MKGYFTIVCENRNCNMTYTFWKHGEYFVIYYYAVKIEW